MTEDRDPDTAMLDGVRLSPLPVMLIRLRDAGIVEISDALAGLFGRRRENLLGRPAADLVVGPWTAEATLLLLAAGPIEGLRTHDLTWRAAGGSTFTAEGWMSTYGPSPARYGVAVLLPVPADLPSPVEIRGERAAPAPAVGTVDADWVVNRVSAEVEGLLGSPPTDVVGLSLRSAVHPADLPALLIAVGHAWHGDAAATVRVRLRGAGQEWLAVRAVVSRIDREVAPAFAFTISLAAPVVGTHGRAHELERQIRVLAQELGIARHTVALGQMPTAVELPALASLSARELEIARRLLAGDRVPLIARSLFLSDSTVRNHLTHVFRKLGVGSQQELLTTLRPPGQEVPSRSKPGGSADHGR